MNLKKLKGGISITLSLAFLFTSINCFANSFDSEVDNEGINLSEFIKNKEEYKATKQDLLDKNISEMVLDVYNQNDNSRLRISEGTFIHNNGKKIESDIIEEKRGNELFGIYIYNVEGVPVQSFYLSNVENESIDNIYGSLMKDYNENIINKSYKSSKNVGGIAPTGVHRMNYTFKSGNTTGYLYSDIEGYKRGVGTVDGKKASTWDFVALGRIESKNGRVSQHRIRLDVTKSPNEYIPTYTPQGNKNSIKGSLSVGLSTSGPSISWTFPNNVDNISMQDLSSGQSYGRWAFNAKVGYPCTKIAFAPAIRVRNMKGRIYVHASQVTKLIASEHSTSVHTISFSDL